MNQRPIEIIQKFKKFDLGEIGISTITVSELQYGAVKSKNRKLNIQRIEEFLVPLEIMLYDHNAAIFYGDVRYNFEKNGETIGPFDLLIAAHALSKGIVLITNNEKEFQRIKNLKIENWIK